MTVIIAVIIVLLSVVTSSYAFVTIHSQQIQRNRRSLNRHHSEVPSPPKTGSEGKGAKKTTPKSTQAKSSSSTGRNKSVTPEQVPAQKPELVSEIAQKTGMSKVNPETVLSTVLDLTPKTKQTKSSSSSDSTLVTPEQLPFRKPDFVTKIAQKTGMSKTDSEIALSAVLDIITEEVAAGKRISMVGFGTFKLSERAARKGRNPKTGEEIDIAASKYPSFSAGKSFKDRCNL